MNELSVLEHLNYFVYDSDVETYTLDRIAAKEIVDKLNESEKIYNVIEYIDYGNGNAEILKVLSFKDNKKATEYIKDKINNIENIIDYELGSFLVYEDKYGNTIHIELVESEVE